jgi:hypothetical protein
MRSPGRLPVPAIPCGIPFPRGELPDWWHLLRARSSSDLYDTLILTEDNEIIVAE